MNSTKNVWRLKKYNNRSEQQIQQQQSQFQELEFSTKPQNPHSIRRPNNQRKKPGETQEFVFVDLSPKKKTSPMNNVTKPAQNRVTETQFANPDFDQNKKPAASRVARLFRSSSSGNTMENVPLTALKPSLQLEESSLRNNTEQKQLLSSPTIIQHVVPPVSSASSYSGKYQFPVTQSASSPATAYTPSPLIPQLKRSFTSVLEKKRSVSPNRASDYQLNNRQRSSSSASVSLSVSESGRAFLDFGSMNSPMLTNDNSARSNSTMVGRSPVPSPQKVISPLIASSQKFPILQHTTSNYSEQDLTSNSETDLTEESADSDSDDDSDAFKAFTKVVRRNTGRKRTNTVSSISSMNNVVKPTGLVRQHSVTSISSKFGRSSPTRHRPMSKPPQPPALHLNMNLNTNMQNSMYSQSSATAQSFPDLPYSATSTVHGPDSANSYSQDEFNFFEDVNSKMEPNVDRQRRAYLHAKNFSISNNFPTPSTTPTNPVSSHEIVEKRPSLLQPGLDVDRLLDMHDVGLQSPSVFSYSHGEPKYDGMGNLVGNFNVPFTMSGLEMELADDMMFDEFINYDSTVGNEVN
ncbi:hypothetical protein WICPIJ_005096 [Wickerhamomyces pijperi]|uniref:Uncharacterized protein n=1 Tax=Wickerhamomyces pijperi TaxID=599730 RepID=A0A9P8TM41_WICPI|nr:hypothetical protein WICPIJ_005096 [Wickerhamomyces pijperi]